jgi:type VI secretion system Hcp family effector
MSLTGRILMARHLFIPAIGLAILFAAQQGYADSCSFTTSQQGTVSSSGANGNSNTFDIDDFSFDIGEARTIGSQSSGAGAGKVSFSPFKITKKMDSSSPQLFQSAVNGEAIRSVSCTFFRDKKTEGEAVGPYLTAILTNATITRFKVDGTGTDVPRVSFWLTYERIDWSF